VSLDQKIRCDLIQSVIGPERGRILEVGCGGGTLSTMLAAQGHSVFACDVPTPFGVPIAPRFFLANGCRLPVASGLFDYTISTEVLEHVPPEGRQMFLEELMRVTRPNGKIVLTAFIRRTFSFRLYGAAWLMASGALPLWYAEHVMIPPPTAPEIRTTFSSLSGRVLFSREYVGPLELFFMWIQNATKWTGLTKGASLIGKLDRMGRKTSYMVAVQKQAVAANHGSF
jgi:SAM-dependent methyltransferase